MAPRTRELVRHILRKPIWKGRIATRDGICLELTKKQHAVPPLSPFKGMVYWYIRLALAKAVCLGIGGYIDPPPGQGALVVCCGGLMTLILFLVYLQFVRPGREPTWRIIPVSCTWLTTTVRFRHLRIRSLANGHSWLVKMGVTHHWLTGMILQVQGATNLSLQPRQLHQNQKMT